MSHYGQQPGYPQQPHGSQPYQGQQFAQPGFQPPMGNQPPAYGQQPQFAPPAQAIRLSKDNPIFGLSQALQGGTQFRSILRWDGRGVDLAKLSTLPPGYSTPQQFTPPAYGQNPHQQHFSQQNPHQQYGQPQPAGASPVDLDISALIVSTSTGRVPDSNHFVFYNKKHSPDGRTIVLDGDNRTGAGNDDEIMNFDLAALTPPQGQPPLYRIVVTASIYGPQRFSDIKKAEICIVGPQGNVLAEFDLDANGKTGRAVIFGELVYDLNQGGWHFCAIGRAVPSLEEVLQSYGLAV